METAIPYVLFLIACYALAYVVVDIATEAVLVIRDGNRRTVKFKYTMRIGPLAFTYIMGYIFLY